MEYVLCVCETVRVSGVEERDGEGQIEQRREKKERRERERKKSCV